MVVGKTIDVWGPCAWNTLHSFCHTSPHSLRREERDDMRRFLLLFAKHLPCPSCRRHFTSYLQENLNEEILAGRKSLVRFMNDAHNSVNRRLGKREWSLQKHYKAYGEKGRAPNSTTASTIVVLLVLSFLLRKRIIASYTHSAQKNRLP
jgi:hypothetical protein